MDAEPLLPTEPAAPAKPVRLIATFGLGFAFGLSPVFTLPLPAPASLGFLYMESIRRARASSSYACVMQHTALPVYAVLWLPVPVNGHHQSYRTFQHPNTSIIGDRQVKPVYLTSSPSWWYVSELGGQLHRDVNAVVHEPALTHSRTASLCGDLNQSEHSYFSSTISQSAEVSRKINIYLLWTTLNSSAYQHRYYRISRHK